MSLLGGVVGAQEGFEAGLGFGGVAISEEDFRRAAAVCLLATAVGVIVGHTIGQGAIGAIDGTIGDGGIGFVPAMAIGGSVMWHNLRSAAPGQNNNSFLRSLPLVAVALYTSFEGAEAGILTATTGSSLLTAETVTVGTAATVGTLMHAGSRATRLAHNPRTALSVARAAASFKMHSRSGSSAGPRYDTSVKGRSGKRPKV